MMGLPQQGRASTYSDHFINRKTASGETYHHRNFTAALLPKSNWAAVPMGTLLKLTFKGRSVVSKVNDRGAGATDKKTGSNQDPHRVLDLSRAAMASLLDKPVGAMTDGNAGVLDIERIEVVPAGTPLGPWSGQ